MITEIIRDRIMKASLEINSATSALRHILRSIAECAEKPRTVDGGSIPVSPASLSLSRAMDLLESELVGLQRELVEFRSDEPQEVEDTNRRYK
jgi:hypothetical protein